MTDVATLLKRLEARNFSAERVPDRASAREAVLRRVPAGATVMAGASTTLDEIGVTDAMKSGAYDYLRAKVWAEDDPEKRHALRMRAMTAPWFLGSVNAITEEGILVAADNGGSRAAAYVAGPERVVIVASLNKVVPDLDAAMRRVREVAAPKEQERVNRGPVKYASRPNKWVILEGEPRPGRTHVILVDEPLGF